MCTIRTSRGANVPGAEFPSYETILEYIEHHTHESPETEAVVLGDARVSYRKLDAQARQWAASLHVSGVKRGDRVAFCGKNGPDSAIVLLACGRIGAIFVGLDPDTGPKTLSSRLNETDPAVLILLETPAGHVDRLIGRAGSRCEVIAGDTVDKGTWEGHVTTLGTFIARGRSRGNSNRPKSRPPDPDAPFTIVYTSGSTGEPKGALLSQRNFVSAMRAFRRAYRQREDLLEGLRVYNPLPISNNGGQSDLLCIPLMLGGTVVFDAEMDVARWIRLIESEKLTMLYATPMIHQLRFMHPDFHEADASSVMSMAWTGEAASRALLRHMLGTGAYVWGSYGVTEAGTLVSVTTPETDTGLLAETLGVMPPDYEYRIVDEIGIDLPAGNAGELWLRGPGVFLGYWNGPEMTRRVLSPEGWYRTGDLVRLAEDGNLSLEGRIDERFSQNHPGASRVRVEDVLANHPLVAMAAVVGAGTAHIVPQVGTGLDQEELRRHCVNRLPGSLVPSEFVFHVALPLLPTGKVDRQALVER